MVLKIRVKVSVYYAVKPYMPEQFLNNSGKNVRIYVANVMDVDADGIEALYIRLKDETNGKLVTLLTVAGHVDVLKYSQIGQAVNQHSHGCIIVTSCASHSSMDMAFNIARQMGDTDIGHEMDCYKALQKAIDAAGENGCVLVLSQLDQ